MLLIKLLAKGWWESWQGYLPIELSNNLKSLFFSASGMGNYNCYCALVLFGALLGATEKDFALYNTQKLLQSSSLQTRAINPQKELKISFKGEEIPLEIRLGKSFISCQYNHNKLPSKPLQKLPINKEYAELGDSRGNYPLQRNYY